MVCWVRVHDMTLVKGNQCLEQEVCVTAGCSGDACYQQGQIPEGGPNVECSAGLAGGRGAD